MFTQRFFRIITLCVLGVVLGLMVAWTQVRQELRVGYLADIQPAAGVETGSASVGGAFTLTDHTGKTVTEQDYAGSYKLVFFGFTYCPEICPTELQKMAAALNMLGDEAGDIQPIFVTTDPARDTPDVMEEYVALYHPRLVGLTGTQEQIDAMQAAYKVYAEKAEEPGMNGYMMNHSAYMYFMGPNDDLLALFSSHNTPSEIVKEIRRVRQQS